MIFWHDDQFRYDGQRGSWDDTHGDPNDEHYPARGYVERVQRHIDDPSLDDVYLGMAAEGGDLPCRG